MNGLGVRALFLAILFFSPASQAGFCRNLVAASSNAIGFGLQSMIYPLWASATLVKKLVSKETAKKNRESMTKALIKRHLPRAVLYSALIHSSSYGVVTNRMIKQEQLLNETRPAEPTVFVSTFTENDPMGALAKSAYTRAKAIDSRTLWIQASDITQLRISVSKAFTDFGSFSNVEIHAHGVPGGILIGENVFYLNELNMFKNRLAAGARVRFFACLVGNGNLGIKEMNEFGKRYLWRGGEILGSRLLVVPSASDIAGSVQGEPVGENTAPILDRGFDAIFLGAGVTLPITAALVYPDLLQAEEYWVFSEPIRRITFEAKPKEPDLLAEGRQQWLESQARRN